MRPQRRPTHIQRIAQDATREIVVLENAHEASEPKTEEHNAQLCRSTPTYRQYLACTVKSCCLCSRKQFRGTRKTRRAGAVHSGSSPQCASIWNVTSTLRVSKNTTTRRSKCSSASSSRAFLDVRCCIWMTSYQQHGTPYRTNHRHSRFFAPWRSTRSIRFYLEECSTKPRHCAACLRMGVICPLSSPPPGRTLPTW